MRNDELLKRYQGLYIGTVVDVRDPLQLGRVRLDTDQYGDSGGADGGVWALVARPWASNGVGVHFTPREGDQVVVGYVMGDVGQPVVLGYAHSHADPPPDPVNEKRHGVVTKIGSVLFDEEAETIEVKLFAPESSITFDKTGIVIKAPNVTIDAAIALKLTGGATAKMEAPMAAVVGAAQAAIAGASVSVLGAPSFGGMPPAGFSFPAVPPPPPSGPADLDFSERGVRIVTGDKAFCVNGQGVALRKFVEDIFNKHVHTPDDPDPAWSRLTDPSGLQVTKCEEP